jgi:hypothetical protein
MNYHFLADDLDFLNDGFDTDPNRNARQITEYPKPSKGKSITHEQYARETEHGKLPLLLFADDGYDGGPVGSLGYKAARAFWYMAGDHIFPPLTDLIRLAFFFHLEIHYAAFLVLKGEWERFYARENGYKTGMGEKFTDVMTITPDETRLQQFTVETANIYETIRSLYQLVRDNAANPSGLGAREELARLNQLQYDLYDRNGFDALIHELILNKLYLQAIDAPTLADFSAKKRNELETLQNGTSTQQQEFWVAKCAWLELQEQLGDVLLAVEQSRLRNAHIVTDFLKIFGALFVALQELVLRVRSLEHRIMLKEAKPELTEAEVVATLRNQEEQDLKTLEKLKCDAELAPWLESEQQSAGGAIDNEAFQVYLRQIKKTLRELFFLIHDDYLRNHPAYERLTDGQKSHLHEMMQRVLAIKQETELCYQQGTVGYENRSLGELLDILAQAKIILNHAGLDIAVEYVICGDTVTERIQWLEKEITRLEKGIRDAKTDLIFLNADQDVREKKAILDCPAQHERIKAEMRGKLADYEAEKNRLEEEYQKLFGVTAS